MKIEDLLFESTFSGIVTHNAMILSYRHVVRGTKTFITVSSRGNVMGSIEIDDSNLILKNRRRQALATIPNPYREITKRIVEESIIPMLMETLYGS